MAAGGRTAIMTMGESFSLPAVAASPHAVDRAICADLVRAMLHAPMQAGTVLRKGQDTVDTDLRVCHQVLLPASPLSHGLAAAMRAAAASFSGGASAGWGMDGPLYSRYPLGGMFRTHTDSSDDQRDPACVRQRRLSIVCFLNDWQEHEGVPGCEGGALVVYEPAGNRLAPRIFLPQAGTIVVFDPGLMHEVRPVLRGERFSAIAWLYSTEENEHETSGIPQQSPGLQDHGRPGAPLSP